ncbi:hypothetical protein [Shimia sp. FJ5]|uniref:hypothetical protein n=1 Tax=Shimia sp. FJ5 TaxID=3079054 RepID=UPI00293DC43F|nr:hypothetical protein [Shimia sp. FJ5]MDV4146648.1 hypothetical protein [Shimia sp. FJ5]
MQLKSLAHLSGLLLLTTALSGCLGNGGGAGGGGGGGGDPKPLEDYDTAYDAMANTLATTTQLTGNANYQGQVKVEVLDQVGGQAEGHIVGDIDLNVAFGGPVEGTVSGTATNFRGTVNNQDVSLSGTLDTANSNLPNITAPSEQALPTGGSIWLTNLSAGMRGTLTDDETGESSDTELSLLGTFVGTNGSGAHGAAAMTIDNANTPVFIAGGGTFYLERQ